MFPLLPPLMAWLSASALFACLLAAASTGVAAPGLSNNEVGEISPVALEISDVSHPPEASDGQGVTHGSPDTPAEKPTYTSPQDPFDRLLRSFELTPEERDRMMVGEVVVHDVTRPAKANIAVSACVFLPEADPTLLDYLQSECWFAAGGAVREFTLLPPVPTAADIRGFGAKRDMEADLLLGDARLKHFNLSTAEAGRMAELAAQDLPKVEARIQAEELYRALLLRRLAEYRDKGLGALEPYARPDGSTAAPGLELAQATAHEMNLDKALPAFHLTLSEYPRYVDPQVDENFHWLRVETQERPNQLLSHRLAWRTADGVVLADRRFSIGHTYTAAQVLVGAALRDGGAYIFLTTRVATDQVAGFAEGLRQRVARKRLLERTRERFESIRAQYCPLPTQSELAN